MPRYTRAGTSYSLPVPTGLAWEQGSTTAAGGRSLLSTDDVLVLR